MDDKELTFWLGLVWICIMVLGLMAVSPVSKALNEWKIRRAFRARDRSAATLRKNQQGTK